MYSPRSFPYLQSSPPRSTRSKSEKMGTRARASPSPRSVMPVTVETNTQSMNKNMSISNIEAATTQPVVIPPRTPLKSATSTQTVRMRGQNGGRPARNSQSHDAKALPPAVAALQDPSRATQYPLCRLLWISRTLRSHHIGTTSVRQIRLAGSHCLSAERRLSHHHLKKIAYWTTRCYILVLMNAKTSSRQALANPSLRCLRTSGSGHSSRT